MSTARLVPQRVRWLLLPSGMTNIDKLDLATITGGLGNGTKCALSVGAGALGLGAVGHWAGPVTRAPKLVTAIGALDGAVAAYNLTPACHAR